MINKRLDNFQILPREFYEKDTPEVAKKLLGKKLVHKVGQNYIVGIISETEAYRADDPASHCYIGKTERNKAMFGSVGCAYIYISYGIHFCFNIVARDIQLYDSGGVLIRAVIPMHGIEFMNQNRGQRRQLAKISGASALSGSACNLTNGPGKLTQAFGITKQHYGLDLTRPRANLFVADSQDLDESEIIATPRIGISCAKDKLWRFVLSRK